MKPRATAPDRKSYCVVISLFLHFPDESPDKRNDRCQSQCKSKEPQVDIVRPDDEVQYQRQIVQREETETNAAPEQQPRPIAPVATTEQPRAGRARQKAENVNNRREDLSHPGPFEA